MVHRKVSLLLAVCAVAALGWSLSNGAEEKADQGHAAHMQQCAKACAECMRECESCMHHCTVLVADGKKEHVTTLQSCADCAEICASAGKIVARQGPMANVICEACVKACNVCGAACEKFPSDEHMTRCAKTCRECERACREMLKHMGADGTK